MARKEDFTGALITRPDRGIPLNLLDQFSGQVKGVCAVLDSDDSRTEFARIISLVFHAPINTEDIRLNGSETTERDRFFANEFGFVILPLAYAKLNENKVDAWIEPALVPKDYPLAQIQDNNPVLLDMEEGTQLSYYLRLTVKDNPGVLSSVCYKLADEKISIREIRQPKADPGSDQTEIAFIFHRCDRASLEDALKKIKEQNGVSQVDSVFKVLLPQEKTSK